MYNMNYPLVNLIEAIMTKTHKLSIFAVFLDFYSLKPLFCSSGYASNARFIWCDCGCNGPVTISYIADDGTSIGRVAEIGDDIYLNDEITTGADMSLQIYCVTRRCFLLGQIAALFSMNSSMILPQSRQPLCLLL